MITIKTMKTLAFLIKIGLVNGGGILEIEGFWIEWAPNDWKITWSKNNLTPAPTRFCVSHFLNPKFRWGSSRGGASCGKHVVFVRNEVLKFGEAKRKRSFYKI